MRANPLIVLIIASACIDSTGMHEGEASTELEGCKLEGDLIGRENVTVELGSKTVTVRDWVLTADGAFVGFSLEVAGGTSVSYLVNARPSTAATWLAPGAPIATLDFCGECDRDGCGP